MSQVIEPKSLIHIARQMHREADALAPFTNKISFDDEIGATAQKHTRKLAELRAELLQSKTETAMDRLMMFATVRAVLRFMQAGIAELDDRTSEPLLQISGGLCEALIGLSQLREHFETEAGSTLASLNLFCDDTIQ